MVSMVKMRWSFRLGYLLKSRKVSIGWGIPGLAGTKLETPSARNGEVPLETDLGVDELSSTPIPGSHTYVQFIAQLATSPW